MDPETTDDFKEEEKPESRLKNILKLIFFILLHLFFFGYFIWCSVVYFRYDKSSSKCKDKSEFNASGDVPANETANATASVFQPHILCSINWCTGYGFLMIFFIVFYILWLYYNIFKPYVGQRIYDAAIEPVSNQWMVFSRRNLVSITMLLCAIAIVIAILAYESRRDASKLVGIAGPVAFIAIGYVFSRNRSAIPWRIVVHGILGQFLLGIVCLNFNLGRSILNCVSNKVVTMLSFTSFGIKFAYGERIYNELLFAFGVLSVFFYLSVITSCLYYLGVMQKMLRLFGWWLQVLIGTTACENFNAVGNIFLSMSESLLLIQPYIDRLTKSELHAICVSGYATVSSTMMGAYVLHGASPAYLLTASVMAVPGSLAFSKLLYPETEESLTKSENIQQEESKETSLLDAASSGAARSIMIVLAIVSTIIAFISIVACFNAIVEWTFLLAGVPNINLIWILTQVALPFVFLMGVPLEDCQKIANIVAEKTIINEFVAFIKLGKLIKNYEVNAHSAAIATFATCAFANPGSLAILVAALCVMAPTRRTDIVKVSLRAFLTSSIVSFTSASFAGILINPGEFDKMAYSFFEVEDNRNAELWFNAE